MQGRRRCYTKTLKMFLRATEWDKVGPFDFPKMKSQDFFRGVEDIADFKKFTGRFTDSDRYKCVHFFLDDFRWTALESLRQSDIKKMAHCLCVVSPDYSIFSSMPSAMIVYQLWKNRFFLKYFCESGLNVIPSVMWAGHYNNYSDLPPGLVYALPLPLAGMDKFITDYQIFISRKIPSYMLLYGGPADLPKSFPTTPNFSRFFRRRR